MEFNRDVASWVYGTISKMDDGEAQLFTRLLADDLYETDLQNNARMFARHAARVEKAVTSELAADFLFRLEHGADPEQLVAEAAAVAIAKDFNENQPRDRSGRWTKGQIRAAKQQIRANAQAAQANLLAENKNHKLRPLIHNYEEQWNRAPTESGATDAMHRVGAAGNLAFGVGSATGSTKLQVAGAAASLVGQYGPEAEKVVGPAMRRTAYRYRGTERTPESGEIKQAANQVAMTQFPVGDRDGMAPLGDLKSGGVRPEAVQRLKTQALRDYAMQEGAAKHLSTKLPSSRLANLHLQSGQIPPSEGVIINRDGKVVAQAVGFAEDHYLPFNLKKMGELQGGRYVRTRTSGGPTTEDIYASLMSGSRSFTVVSRSGEFTVDLADDFRGARRASDKAKSMVTRYGNILDAVQSEQVRKMPNSARDRAEVRAEIEEELKALEAKDPNFSRTMYGPEQIDRYVNQRLIQRRANPDLTKDEYDKIEAVSWRGINRANPTDEELKQQRKISSQLERQLKAEKGQNGNFKLDGEGYKAALDALREQFPYFIDDVRVTHNRDDPETFSDVTDRGYVDQRYTRAGAQRTGLFGNPDLGVPSTKRSAAQTDYQNWRERKKQGGAPAQGQAAQREVEAPSPVSVAADASREAGVRAAKAQRDQTTANAAKFWIPKFGGPDAQRPEIKALMDFAQVPEELQGRYLAEHGDEVRANISWLKETYPQVTSPDIIDNVADAGKPKEMGDPLGERLASKPAESKPVTPTVFGGLEIPAFTREHAERLLAGSNGGTPWVERTDEGKMRMTDAGKAWSDDQIAAGLTKAKQLAADSKSDLRNYAQGHYEDLLAFAAYRARLAEARNT